LAAKVLATALIAEIVVILALDFGIVRDVGLAHFSLRGFSTQTVFASGFGIAAIYAFNGMIGVEGTAIYQEEARDTRVTIPRATYISVALVGLFYVFTAWCLTSAVGDANVAAVARQDPGRFIIDRASTHLGKLGSDAISLLVLTSSIAAALALFNNSTRYLYALARDGVLPAALAKTHRRHGSPYIAGAVLTIGLVTVLGCASIARLDPLVNISTALVGLGSVGLMTLLAVTALAIPIFFARRSMFSLAKTAAPTAGGLVIAAATYLAFRNYSALTGVESTPINHLPYLLIAIALVGTVQARWLRAHRPEVYQSIGRNRIEGG
jgi:amino acid transporter